MKEPEKYAVKLYDRNQNLVATVTTGGVRGKPYQFIMHQDKLYERDSGLSESGNWDYREQEGK